MNFHKRSVHGHFDKTREVLELTFTIISLRVFNTVSRSSRYEKDVDGHNSGSIVEDINDINFVLDIVFEIHDEFLDTSRENTFSQSFRSTSWNRKWSESMRVAVKFRTSLQKRKIFSMINDHDVNRVLEFRFVESAFHQNTWTLIALDNLLRYFQLWLCVPIYDYVIYLIFDIAMTLCSCMFVWLY